MLTEKELEVRRRELRRANAGNWWPTYHAALPAAMAPQPHLPDNVDEDYTQRWCTPTVEDAHDRAAAQADFVHGIDEELRKLAEKSK